MISETLFFRPGGNGDQMVLIQEGDFFTAHFSAETLGSVFLMAAVGDVVFPFILCYAGVAAAGDPVPSLQEDVVMVVIQRHDIRAHGMFGPSIPHGIAVIQHIVNGPAEEIADPDFDKIGSFVINGFYLTAGIIGNIDAELAVDHF